MRHEMWSIKKEGKDGKDGSYERCNCVKDGGKEERIRSTLI